MIIKENGRLFIALPNGYSLADLANLQIGIIDVISRVDWLIADTSYLWNMLDFLSHTVITSQQISSIEDEALTKALDKENLKWIDEKDKGKDE